MAKTNWSEKYWERRRNLEDKAREKMEDDMIKSLTTDIFPEALKKIQEKLLSQADMHKMTQNELLADVSKRDQEKYRKYIDENYQELMSSDEKYQEFIDEYFPSYDYAKVNRLLQIRSDIFSIMASEMIKKDANETFNKGLEDIINRTYASNSNALMHILGVGEVTPLPKNELANMLNYPWSGKTFSSRLWGNVSALEQRLSNSIVNAIASGEGVVEALKTMRNDSTISDMFKLEEGKFNRAIENLVRTEYAHFAVEGVKKSVHDAGITDMQSWSAEDERVCDVCGTRPSGRHGKIIKDGWFPPYHGRCRCTVIPKMPELPEDIDLLYEEMFGDLLDEFANDQFGIKLTHPKLSRKADTKESEHDIIKVKFNESVQDGMKDSQAEILENILNNAPESVRRLWSRLQDDLVTVSSTSSKSFYRKDDGVYFNYKEDSNHPEGKDSYTTFFHEYGHHIDSLFGKKTKKKTRYKSPVTKKWVIQTVDDWEYKSKDLGLSDSLQSEYTGLKKQYGVRSIGDLVVSMKKYAHENYPRGYNGVSDIISGITMDQYSLGWHHSKKYWRGLKDADGLGKEAFAHMFQAYAMQNDAHEFMMETFPESYQIVIDFIEKEGGQDV